MWRCNKCGREVVASCCYDRGPILTGITQYGDVDESKIYQIDLFATGYCCEGTTYDECNNEGDILTDIAYWED